MADFTPALEQQIRDLGLALKLQLDFARAADMTKPDDAMIFARNNSATAILMIDVMRQIGIPMQNDADALEKIAAFARQHNSTAGDTLAALAPVVRAINAETAQKIEDSMKDGNSFTAADLNKILRKHLKP